MSGIGQAGMREDGKPGVGTVQAQMHGEGKPGGGTVQAQMHGDGKPGGGTVQDKRPRNGARKPGKSRKGGILPGLCSALSILLLVTVVGLCIPMTVPRLFGYEVYTVVSGSMEPAIPVGSAIYLQTVAPETVTVGDVIAFYRGRGVVTHRVVENRTVSGEFITKGDANEENDMEPVPYSAVLGRMAGSVPVLGTVMAVCSGSMGKAYLAGGVAGALFLQLLAAMMRKGQG